MILVFVFVWFCSFDVIHAFLELSVRSRMLCSAHCRYGYLSSIILILCIQHCVNGTAYRSVARFHQARPVTGVPHAVCTV